MPDNEGLALSAKSAQTKTDAASESKASWLALPSRKEENGQPLNEVEVSVRARCGADWDQGELARRQLGLLTSTAHLK